MHDRRSKLRPKRAWKRYALWVAAGFVAICIVGNIAMWLAYRGKVLPNVSLGAASVGSMSYKDLDQKVDMSKLLPSQVVLTKDAQTHTLSPQQAGITVNWQHAKERLERQRSWLPLINLFTSRTVPVELTIDDQQFATAQSGVAAIFVKAAQPERIVFSGQNFEIATSQPGYTLDETVFKQNLLAAVEAGQTTLAVPTQVAEPPASQANLAAELQALRKKVTVQITFTLNGQTIQPSAADIGGWFVASGQTMVFSADKAKAYITGINAAIFNKGNAASAASYAFDKLVATNVVLSTTQAPAKYTYCAATKGVDQANLPGFIAKTAAVLGDPRGWNAGGKVAFERVESDCDFSLWLSAPSQMTSFGGVCDNYYSCRSGRNVVINFDRWQGATDPWNASGGNLEDYRVMVTNHEVGHWLGFGHSNCPGAGQPAPVMQQQSINLQGCKFNPWPTTTELSNLKQTKGIAGLQVREEYIAAGGSSCCCAHCAG
ncbi:MAG TPA: DUF3152 domain-containing protein [Candidatus Saccharimonadales bacterium]|nr:DUF3152 domain-containing protein [Candidatus Saccharimonadales bacterium]